MHLFWFCAHSLSCFNAYFILSSHLDASVLVWSHLVSSSSLNAFLLFSLFYLIFFFWPIWTGPMLLFFSHLTSVILCYSVCLILIFPFGLILSYYMHTCLIMSMLISSGLISTQCFLILFWHVSSFIISISSCLISFWCIMVDPFSRFVLTTMFLFRSHLYGFFSSFSIDYNFFSGSSWCFSSHRVLLSNLFPWSRPIRSHLFSTLFWHYFSLLILFFLCLVTSSHFFLITLWCISSRFVLMSHLILFSSHLSLLSHLNASLLVWPHLGFCRLIFSPGFASKSILVSSLLLSRFDTSFHLVLLCLIYFSSQSILFCLNTSINT